MITAVDSNVLIDVFLEDPHFGKSSAQALRICLNEGAVMLCGVVFVELMPLFPTTEVFMRILDILNIKETTISMQSFRVAAPAWKSYLDAGGKKNRIVADFFIGAHALTECDRLLTRDRGFYRQYFKKLVVIEPK